MGPWSRHQYLRTTETTRSRPQVDVATTNRSYCKETWSQLKEQGRNWTRVDKRDPGRDINSRSRPEKVNWAFLLRISPGVFFFWD